MARRFIVPNLSQIFSRRGLSPLPRTRKEKAGQFPNQPLKFRPSASPDPAGERRRKTSRSTSLTNIASILNFQQRFHPELVNSPSTCGHDGAERRALRGSCLLRACTFRSGRTPLDKEVEMTTGVSLVRPQEDIGNTQ
jgi:hypothetical protein